MGDKFQYEREEKKTLNKEKIQQFHDSLTSFFIRAPSF